MNITKKVEQTKSFMLENGSSVEPSNYYWMALKTRNYGRGESGMLATPLFGRGESGILATPLFGRGESGMLATPLLGRGESGMLATPLLLVAVEIAKFVAATIATVTINERNLFVVDDMMFSNHYK